MVVSNKDKLIFDHWNLELLITDTSMHLTTTLENARSRATRIQEGFVLAEATYYSQLLTELFKND